MYVGRVLNVLCVEIHNCNQTYRQRFCYIVAKRYDVIYPLTMLTNVGRHHLYSKNTIASICDRYTLQITNCTSLIRCLLLTLLAVTSRFIPWCAVFPFFLKIINQSIFIEFVYVFNNPSRHFYFVTIVIFGLTGHPNLDVCIIIYFHYNVCVCSP